jgi:two-component system nitrogen regulation response regulator GlnG/two-component system response regulator HydG
MDGLHARIVVPGLVVLWSRDEPERVGEVVLLPAGDSGPWVFGRGDVRDGERRVMLVRQRPGIHERTDVLRCPRVSRSQLRLVRAPAGGILAENVGRCALVYRGRPVASAELAPGDTVSLRNEILFLCVRRGPLATAAEGEPALPIHAFGQPDALGLIGESPAAWELRRRIAAMANQPLHVAILGPSGSGKELIARAIHVRSPRGNRPIVSRNAATLPEGLVDAELFGNVRNYPNPGLPERPGLVGQAHGSTLFLDEFGELPQTLQAHLLRLMDDGEYQRLGEATARRADIRVLAATNRKESDLREDVLARLKLRIVVPGLEHRREDIPLIAIHLLRRHAASDPSVLARFFQEGDPSRVPRLSPLLVEALVRHSYTTHVRELETLLLGAVLESRGRYVSLSTPPREEDRTPIEEEPTPIAPTTSAALAALTPDEHVRLLRLRRNGFSPTACGRDPGYPGNRQTADLHLRQLICKVMQIVGWETRRAAELLAGGEAGPLRDKSSSRIETFLANLRRRIETHQSDELRKELVEEWKGSADAVLHLVGALREGRVKP